MTSILELVCLYLHFFPSKFWSSKFKDFPSELMRDKDSRMENEWKSSIEAKDNAIKVKHLMDEIQRLKRLIGKITDSMTWGNSVIKVVFRDEFYEEKYKSKVEDFLKETLDKDENFILNSQIYDSGEQEFCKLQSTLQAERLNKTSSNEHKASDAVPLYSSAFEDVLHCDESKADEENVEEKAQMMTCFNCLGDHHMKQCPEKIDFLKVAAHKKDILMENSARYHVEEKKNAIKPGILSTEVRQALGLNEDQLPPYIYRMRVIGYPPGWMSDALFETSGLSLYDEDGKAITDSESVMTAESGKKYDSSKFVEYPGFNSPVPSNIKDEWISFGMLPIQPHHQLAETANADNTINSSNMYKRKNATAAEEEETKKVKNASATEEEETEKVKNGTNDANDSLTLWSPENCSTPKKQESHSINTSNGTPSIKKMLGNSISQSPGTPILEQSNPYQKLPEFNKFAQGITEHLPFENLPDSVGKFEKMRGILSDVQKKLQTLKKES